MKTIGMIGGMSWESTREYYRIINERVKAKLGGLHSAQCVLYSFDFHEIEALQHAGDWAGATKRMIAAGQALERGGADFLIICANTMHKMADEVQAAVSIPLLHIADATAECVKAAGLRNVGLLGTRFTMEQDFYAERLRRHGLTVSVPEPADRQVVNDVLYNEVCRGVIREESRQQYRAVIHRLAEQGCEGIIFGCTEIILLVGPEDSPVPVFDTTVIHAEASVEWALADCVTA